MDPNKNLYMKKLSPGVLKTHALGAVLGRAEIKKNSSAQIPGSSLWSAPSELVVDM